MEGFYKILLKKRIPIGAGMGGGSSDAAATIRLLTQLAGSNLSDKKIGEIAAALGSDVSFFACANGQSTAVVRGRGERVEFIEWPFSVKYVVVYPDIRIPSVWAYSRITDAGKSNIPVSERHQTHRAYSPSGTPTRFVSPYEQCVERLAAHTIEVEEFFQSLVNDLEAPVLANYPILERIKRFLIDLGAVTALMTGSGSAVYGVFLEKKKADTAAKRLRARNWSVFTLRPVPVNGSGKKSGPGV